MIEPHHQPRLGWGLLGLGAVMMITSFVLAGGFGIAAPVVHNVLQVGGFVMALAGILLIAGLFFPGDDGGTED